MALTPAKRKAMEKLVLDTMALLDPSGNNTDKYKKKFKAMSDKQFDDYFKNIFNEDTEDHLTLDVVEYERDLKIEYVEKAANFLNVPLFEYVALPFLNMDTNDPVTTMVRVPVGWLHNKRMQQTLLKKNTTSTEIGTRSSLTGQVTGKDKNARDSDAENFALSTIEANDTLREFLGPRSDDMVMKNEMYSDIAKKGYTNLAGLTNDLDNKTILNAIDIRFIGMGIKTDMITKGLVLKKTFNDRDIK